MKRGQARSAHIEPSVRAAWPMEVFLFCASVQVQAYGRKAHGRGFNPRLQPMALRADAVPHKNELLPYPGLEQKNARPAVRASQLMRLGPLISSQVHALYGLSWA